MPLRKKANETILSVREAEEGAPMPEGGSACRCKEASDMKPRQLLKLMMDDLAFWKKLKKK